MAFKRGFILLWSGAIADIPYGWYLCNGANGTPDLRDRFVVGAGSTYNPDDSGGSNTHTHDFTSDSHTHSIGAGTDIQDGLNWDKNTDGAVVTGTTNAQSHLPQYYALAYIMKS